MTKLKEILVAAVLAYACHSHHHVACLSRQLHVREVFAHFHHILS